MITTDGQLEVQEQESGTYVFPNSKLFAPTWAIFVFKDGRAELFLKRDIETGALLGKPTDLGLPVKVIHPLDMCELLSNTMGPVTVIKKKNGKVEHNVHEINGELYFQSTKVKPKTKNFK